MWRHGGSCGSDRQIDVIVRATEGTKKRKCAVSKSCIGSLANRRTYAVSNT
jgi:hypothetical protein